MKWPVSNGMSPEISLAFKENDILYKICINIMQICNLQMLGGPLNPMENYIPKSLCQILLFKRDLFT